MNKTAYAYWLGNVAGVGDKTIRRLLGVHGDPREIYDRIRLSDGDIPVEYLGILNAKQMSYAREATAHWNVEEEYARLCSKGICLVSLDHSDYPGRLKQIADPPYLLYYKGRLPSEEVLSVAVVGARECSEYGRYVGRELGKVLGRNGVQVISGMARGIDGISQAAALEAGGSSFGVLGSGVDVCYPESNKRLYDNLIDQGGILSFYGPGTLPRAQQFAPRNRVVSGLSDAVIVVEARQKSGTLITVDMALEQGREVFVVPGRLTDRLSDGCNRLIKQGAGIVLSPDDFLREMRESFSGKLSAKYHGSEEGQNGKRTEKIPGISQQEQKVYEGLDFYPRSVEEIRVASGLDISYQQIQQILMKLCMTPYIRQIGPGFYEKNTSDTGF